MSSLTIEVEHASSGPKHHKLAQWVAEVAEMCGPEQVYWCDGSPAEYQLMLQQMIQTGHRYPLIGRKTPE